MIADLIKIVGKENVSNSQLDLICHSIDASEIEGNTTAVVWPTNTKQVVELMKYFNKHRVSVFPRAAATNLTGGVIPSGGVVLDVSRMNRILEVGEDYVVVEPGVVLEELNIRLSKKNKTLPVVPASDKAACVGGCIAEDSAGVHAIKYGTMKDWVIELEVVLPTGRILTTDDKSFVGSEGILGVFTKAKLRITPKPKLKTMTVLDIASYGEVQEKVRYYASQDVSQLEFISDVTNSIIKKPLSEKNTLIIEYENDQGEIKDPSEVDRITEERKTIDPQLADEGYILIEDPRMPHEKITEFLTALARENIPSYGHIGYGVIHPQFKNKEDRQKIVELAVKLGADPVGEHGIGLVKKKLKTKEWLIPLKKRYDPNGILNPGKVLPEGDIPDIAGFSACVVCGICRNRCPAFRVLLNDSVSPRGKAVVIDRNIDSDIIYSKCTLCGACDVVCPANARLSEKIREAREKRVREGREMEANKVMMENVRKYGNPFGKVGEGRMPKELYCC